MALQIFQQGTEFALISYVNPYVSGDLSCHTPCLITPVILGGDPGGHVGRSICGTAGSNFTEVTDFRPLCLLCIV